MKLSEQEYLDGRKIPYAWPGGYPRYLLMGDGGCLCMKCAVTEGPSILREMAISFGADAAWQAVAFDINWEDENLYCDNCNEPIESAYGDDDEAV